MRGTAYPIIADKLKTKYESFKWNQHEPGMDVFTDLNKVKTYCGNFGDSVQETTCWLDTFNWSIMKQTKLSEDIYQFISHRSGIVRRSIDNEVENFHINWEALDPIKDTVLEQFKKGVFNFIDLMI
ncbi:hypothetical protein [Cytobacillus oceanisediminis]|uniref:Uncharacterized protein n=1 Tax=Cytobacillus oceanisediminis 2691 TaxID=1196031 RepID=A0A169FLR7_9BACI|nr:hypothetical protein [Cytobacillus oceanisediminis]AND39565.1 hypothetical protein A361_10610 [Cytobacillus oceanisediminis 2691]